MHTLDTVPLEINLLDQKIFKPSSLTLHSVTAESESQEYLAHRLKLGNDNIAFRKAKITPRKIGQFVTLWKRDATGVTCPYHISDRIDYVIILTQTPLLSGIFIFPKEALLKHTIFSDDKKNGKRGFRVYPPWDTVDNAQAQKTQLWQSAYFVDLTTDKVNIPLITRLLKKN
ncbi:MepB family protein [Sphingobacterium bambusae]|uniref:MepB family protein n=1 Tax=Sphingobacterium bambusae TaxID=662858 RepID=A0ABW6BLN4_9SPHI|nr:MepB family protein [Sphingobacterium bambusae]WPL46724.1 MepB family protein [Sphingobacterium bambusae]